MCWELTVSITKRNRFSGLAWSLDAAFGIKAIEWVNHFRMNRRQFLGLSSATAASTLVPAIVRAESPKGTPHGLITLSNGNFTLKLSPGKGLDCSLVHGSSGVVLAQGPYFYSTGAPAFDRVIHNDNTCTIIGSTDAGIEVSHTFRLSSLIPWFEEEITIKNVGPAPFQVEPRFGFTLPSAPGTFDGFIFTAVPFRREPEGNRSQYADYKLDQILHEKRVSILRGSMNWHPSFSEGVHETNVDVDPSHPLTFDVYASEGWAITNGATGFLLTKYQPRAMEWSILDALTTGPDLALRWGGAGIYCGDPEYACQLAPGESFQFGTTRLTAFAGDLTQGFYAFRTEMESRGHRVPHGFNPPLHWNELYDNKLWWLPNNQYNDPEKKKDLYLLKDMEEAAAKAKAIGAEALYMDPGWDVSFASKIWDETRLGPCADYVALMKSKYNLKVSLHTPLSGWCDPSSYAFECCRLDDQGRRDRLSICGASDQYVQETYRRLDVLGQCGACFFMFDGTAFNGPCWDTEHGHPVPSTGHDHVKATNRIANLVHAKHPDVLMEMHDQVIGPRPARYVPIYLGYGKDAHGQSTGFGFDTIWAFELMWDPMTNLGQGNSVCLFYYNLAYSQPLYLHIDLRTDTKECVMFWWNASTCRHLGIGGTHGDPGVRSAQKQAVADYLRLKPHFASGTFYGIDETTHVHRHPTAATAVINCFNLEQTPATRSIDFIPAKYGLAAGKSYKFIGAHFTLSGGAYTAEITIPPMGHQLIEVV
jgi:hypothetical protein